MIDLRNRLLLPLTEANDLRRWLMEPACRMFLDQLANAAAVLAAEAGNMLIEENNQAPFKAEAARVLLAARKLIEQMREPGYQFVKVTLEHQPIIAPTTYANRPSDRKESFPGSSIKPADRPLA